MEINTKGRIVIGEQLELIEELAARENLSSDPIPFEDDEGPAALRQLIPSQREPLEKRRQNNHLEKTGINLELKDSGLCLQYAILGGPGSGKTNLLMHLLSQIVRFKAYAFDLKYGGLILDPKAAMIEDVKAIFAANGRQSDLIIINRRELNGQGVNVLDCFLNPTDLGEAMMIAAQSAGTKSDEPFWFQEIAKIFGAIIALMKFDGQIPTIADVMHFALLKKADVKDKKTRLESLLVETLQKYEEYRAAKGGKVSSINDRASNQFLSAYNIIENYMNSEDRNRRILLQFMGQAYEVFSEFDNLCYSEHSAEPSIYDQIINDGKFVLVSTGPQEIKISSILPTLIKWIFQRSALSRFDRFMNGELRNNTRPLLFMADEYHTVATQVEGNPFGDSEFFSQARQFGALSIVATQSIKQLEVSRLGNKWEAIFGTLAATIFMRQRDPSTSEYAQKYAGQFRYLFEKRSQSTTKDGTSTSDNADQVDENRIPPGVLEHLLKVGQGMLVGTTIGQTGNSSVSYFQAPQFRQP